MKNLEEIGKLYNNLSTDQLIILFFSIFFFCLLILVIVNLKKKNRELIKELESITKKKEKLEQSLEALSKSKNEFKNKTKKLEEAVKMPEPKISVLNVSKEEEKDKKKVKLEKDNSKLYQKNILKDLKATTSPIGLSSEAPTIKELKMNLNDFIKKERKNNNSFNAERESKKKTTDYLMEVSKRLENTPDNKPIELTDYEQKQENEAIISYRELIENKDKIYQISDDEADIEFINELKDFRDSLGKKN